MDVSIEQLNDPSEAERQAVLDPLLAFNAAHGGPSGFETLAILLKRKPTGETVGGLYGKFSYDWLFIELLVVPDDLRGKGLGTRLLSLAEEAAMSRGAVGVWLDTHGFQAPLFYERNGYEIFGTLEDHPRGSRRLFLRKRFGGSAPA